MDVTLILIKLNSPFLLEEFPMKVAGKVEMDLRGIQVLGAQRSWVDGPSGEYGIGFDAPNQTFQGVVELENLVGSSHDNGPLGKRGCVGVGGVGCDAHAIGIQKVNNE